MEHVAATTPEHTKVAGRIVAKLDANAAVGILARLRAAAERDQVAPATANADGLPVRAPAEWRREKGPARRERGRRAWR